MLAPQQTIMWASANLRCEGAVASLSTLIISGCPHPIEYPPPKKKSDHIHYYNNVQMPYTSFLGLPLPLPVFRHAEG